MPVGRIAEALDAATGLGYTGASTAAWTLNMWEYHPTLGKLYNTGRWVNNTSTYSAPVASHGSPSVFLFIFSGGAVCDIAVDDVIDVDLTGFSTNFTVTLPEILPSMFDENDEYWVFLADYGKGSTAFFAVPFEPDRKGDTVVTQLARLLTQGKVLAEAHIIGEILDNDEEMETEDIFVFAETTRVGGGLLIHHEEVVRMSELRVPTNWTEVVEILTASELIYKHGDAPVVGRSGPGTAPVTLVMFAYDSIGTTETLEKAGAKTDDEGGVSWYVEITDPLGVSEAITFNNQADPAVDIVSDIFDFKTNGIKSLEWVHVDWNMDTDNPMSVAIDYRYASSDAWTRSAFVVLNDANLAYIGLAGIEFRLVLTADAYANITPNGPIKVTYKQIDKRGIRGIDAN
jgi:hypothetical protein